MRGWPLHDTLRRIALVVIACCAIASPGVAQQISQEQFRANPSQVLTTFPSGGPQLISLVRELVLGDRANLSRLTGLFGGATAAQASAIGTGLGQAALASVQRDPQLANDIQRALVEAGNQNASEAYASVTGNNVVTAGVGGGAAGGAGGNGGPTGGVVGSAIGTFSASPPTGPSAFPSSAVNLLTGQTFGGAGGGGAGGAGVTLSITLPAAEGPLSQ